MYNLGHALHKLSSNITFTMCGVLVEGVKWHKHEAVSNSVFQPGLREKNLSARVCCIWKGLFSMAKKHPLPMTQQQLLHLVPVLESLTSPCVIFFSCEAKIEDVHLANF